MTRFRAASRLMLGAAAMIVATSAVALAATYAARSDNTVRVAEEALAYGATESLLTAVSVTHARLSEAMVSTAGLDRADLDRIEAVGASLEAVTIRAKALDPRDQQAVSEEVERYVAETEDALIYLETGNLPPAELLASLDEGYGALVGRTEDRRRRAAEALEAARTEVGTLASAASVFVIVFVPVLVLTGVYRALRMRQRRKELEVSLAAEQGLRDERNRLIQAVGHELRTPLTAVVGLSATLRDDESLFPAERHEMVMTVAQQSRELADRIDDLLVLSKIDSDSLDLRPERIDVREIVERILASRPDLEAVEVGGRGWVRADPVYLEHAIRNLIGCAFRSAGRKAEILIRPGSMMLNVEIRDSGPPTETGSLNGEATVDGPSTVGLGVCMAAARRIVEYMNGTVHRTRQDGWNVSLLRLPIAPVKAGDDRVEVGAEIDTRLLRHPGSRITEAVEEAGFGPD